MACIAEDLLARGRAVTIIQGQLNIVRAVEKQLKLRIFSYEYEILVVLFDYGPTTAGDLLSQSSASSTAFYAALKYLLDQGLIIGQTESSDRRRMRYSLTAVSQRALEDVYAQLRQWCATVVDPARHKPRGFSAFIQQLQGVMPMRYLGNDYHILVLVYENGQINAGDLLQLCETSSTTFYVALRRLCDVGLLVATKDAQDKRRTHYRCAAHVREVLDSAHREMHQWLTSRAVRQSTLVGASV